MTYNFFIKRKSITSFERGDVIIRLKNAKDSSYQQPMEFIAIDNNIIYLRYLSGLLNGRFSKAPLELYRDDYWVYYLQAREWEGKRIDLYICQDEEGEYHFTTALRNLTEEQIADIIKRVKEIYY